MKITYISILLLVLVISAKSEESGNPEIKIEQIQFSRILPHAYCDQGKSSIKGMFPNGELLAFKRSGYFPNRPYCLMGYREDKNTDEIIITGVFLIELKAFRFDTKTNLNNYGNTILSVAENIIKYQIQNQ